jgi:plasmid stabilization system protein ParE
VRRVRWAEQAQADFVRITMHCAVLAPDFPERLFDRIEALAAMLALYPDIRARLEGSEARKISVRGTRYILFYRATRDVVEILRVHHARHWRGA